MKNGHRKLAGGQTALTFFKLLLPLVLSAILTSSGRADVFNFVDSLMSNDGVDLESKIQKENFVIVSQTDSTYLIRPNGANPVIDEISIVYLPLLNKSQAVGVIIRKLNDGTDTGVVNMFKFVKDVKPYLVKKYGTPTRQGVQQHLDATNMNHIEQMYWDKGNGSYIELRLFSSDPNNPVQYNGEIAYLNGKLISDYAAYVAKLQQSNNPQ